MTHAQRITHRFHMVCSVQSAEYIPPVKIYTSGTATFILNSIQATHTDALSIVQNELEKILLKISTVLI